VSVGIDEARAVRAGEELPLAALDAWLAQALPQLHGPLAVEQFPSGYSNLTYLLRKGEHELVLRRPPFGAQVKSGHDMAREYKVLHGLAPVYPPAPRPLGQCADASVIGAPFYVMERRRGLVLRRTLPASISPERFGAMCQALVDQLAALHAVDLDAAGLRDLGKPEGYVARQVAGWIDRWQRARTCTLLDSKVTATLPPVGRSAKRVMVVPVARGSDGVPTLPLVVQPS
jgi:aminoglycoside phosphotransferase (APT) family kinase protein